MVTWNDFEEAEPDLARRVRGRFEETGLALVATVRSDGSPRVSGWEPLFVHGALWLGAMPGGRKSLDVRRDPRICLHNATTDKDVLAGDAKIFGRAVEITDEPTRAAYTSAFETSTTQAVPTPFDLFRVDVTEVSMLRPAGDHLDIEWWRPGEPLPRVERF